MSTSKLVTCSICTFLNPETNSTCSVCTAYLKPAKKLKQTSSSDEPKPVEKPSVFVPKHPEKVPWSHHPDEFYGAVSNVFDDDFDSESDRPDSPAMLQNTSSKAAASSFPIVGAAHVPVDPVASNSAPDEKEEKADDMDPNKTGAAPVDTFFLCDGQCGAPLPKLIKLIRATCQASQDAQFAQIVKNPRHIDTIRTHFGTYEFPSRFLLADTAHTASYGMMFSFCCEACDYYKNFRSENHLIYDIKDVEGVFEFLRLLASRRAFDALNKLSNLNCKYGQRSIMSECKENCPNLSESYWSELIKQANNKRLTRVYHAAKCKGHGLSMEEIMAIMLFLDFGMVDHNGVTNLVSNETYGFRHQLIKTCKWKRLFQCVCSGVYKLYQAHHIRDRIPHVYDGDIGAPQNKLFHSCTLCKTELGAVMNQLHVNCNKGKNNTCVQMQGIRLFTASVGDYYKSHGAGLQLTKLKPHLSNREVIAARVDNFGNNLKDVPMNSYGVWIVLPFKFFSENMSQEGQLHKIKQYKSININLLLPPKASSSLKITAYKIADLPQAIYGH